MFGGTPSTQVGRPLSQCARVLRVLSDGLWHSIEDIHYQAGTMRLNSRVADLRSRGYGIECGKSGGRYRYRLVSRPSPSVPGGGLETSVSRIGADEPGGLPSLDGVRAAVAASSAASSAPTLFDLQAAPAWA